MIKIRKLPKKYLEDPVHWLDKGWVDAYIEDFKKQIEGNVRKPSLVIECLPLTTYQRLAALWGLDPLKVPRSTGNTCKKKNTAEEENQLVEDFIKDVEKELGIRSDISEDLNVNLGSTVWDKSREKPTKPSENPYLKFLKKTGSLTDHGKSKTNLGKKAGIITKMIIKKFLEWYQSLGGNDGETFIEESTLHELFQIGFDMPAAKAMAIRTQELPTVPECLALLRNEPKHATRYCLRKFLKNDIKMENIPTKMFAFGRMLPKERPTLRYKPPKNFVRQTWMECSRVPSDLDTMKTVWVGLEKLRSTIAFSNWLKNHPQITPPPYLEKTGLMKINYEEWNLMYKGFEVDADNIEVIASDMKIIQKKPSVQDSKLSGSGSLKMDSYESLL